MKLTKAQKNRIASAINSFGAPKCTLAYRLNREQGEGGTVIEIETGIPKRNQPSALLAGEYLKESSIDTANM